MNIKQVKYFVETVDQGSLSAAAKVQYVTVQAISKAIVNLETEMGATLLERENRGITPTAFGKAFYQKAVCALESFEELESFAASYRQLGNCFDGLCLGLNTPAFIGNETMRQSIAAFIEAQMGVPTTVPLASGDAGFEDLRMGKYDALITIGMFHHSDVRCDIVGTVAPAIMVAATHPLADRKNVSLADLAPYPVANPRWFCQYNETVVSIYKAQGNQLHYIDMTEEEAVEHVCNNKGACITTSIEMLGKVNDDVVLIPLAAADSVAIPVCVVSMKDRVSPLLLKLRQLLLNGLALMKRGKVLR